MTDRGNILVIGKSGVGKSTLINAVLGEECVETGWGLTGTTKNLKRYKGNEELHFCLIDTIGFEPSLLKERQVISEVKKWIKESAKEGREENKIDFIWYCIDGTSSKLFERDIDSMLKATKMVPTVPVVAVITKSYSEEDQRNNIQMVQMAFGRKKNFHNRLKAIVPVVAAPFRINQNMIVPPSGIIRLIDVTNDYMDEGLKAGKTDIENYKLKRRRAFARGVVATAVTSGTVVGAVPVPVADALILAPLEMAEVNGIAYIYGIDKNEESSRFFNSIIEVGTVSVAAKTAISALKAIPGINLGASALNALIAGGIVTAIGEGSIYAFEQIYLGNKSISDIDWVKKLMESRLSSQLVNKLVVLASQINNQTDKKNIVQMILDAFKISRAC